jgi:ribosomal protein S18 acetylase RimI-like enzyme
METTNLGKSLIRRATFADAKLLTELGARTFVETFAADNSTENMSAYLSAAFIVEQQANELSDPERSVFIAEIEGRGVGYAMLLPDDAPSEITGEKPIELVRLYVSKESIGSGVGAALMQACLDEAAARDFQTIWLGVWENNRRAQAFYRKWKFEEVGTHVFQLGDDPQRDLLMQRAVRD